MDPPTGTGDAVLAEAPIEPSMLLNPAGALMQADGETEMASLGPTGMQINPDNTSLGYWTEQEVESLRNAVESLSRPGSDVVDWLRVSAMVPSRSAKQCRQKWLNHLR